MHVHAFSPMEVLNGATKLGVSFEEFLAEAKAHGLGTIPGTAAEILDDDVRWVLTKGKLPADTWEEIVRTAHGLGIRSSSTIMFGHVDAPPHWVGHLRRLARIQADTGGFTEFVPLPFVHQRAPIYLSGKARPGATFEENLRMHAVARIVLDGQIPNIQVSWVKLGAEACRAILRVGGERFRRHADGGDDQPDGGRRVGHRDDAGAVRRIDPRDRPHTSRAHDDVRTGRTVITSGFLTLVVRQTDHARTCRIDLRLGRRSDTMGARRGMRQRTSSMEDLSPGWFFPQNHTNVISGGDERAPLHPLAGTSEMSRIRPGDLLPREGRLIEGGQADLQRVSRPHRVPELRPPPR